MTETGKLDRAWLCALALAVVALAPVMHLPHMIWQLVIVFVLVLAVVTAALTIVLRSARGRLSHAISGLSSGQALFAQAQQSAACNASHTVETRLARCLLRVRDLSGSARRRNTFPGSPSRRLRW